MNQDKWMRLYREVCLLVDKRRCEELLTLLEVVTALGSVIAFFGNEAAKEELRVKQLNQQVPDEEEEEDEDEEFRATLTEAEKAYAWRSLSARYPQEIVCLVGRKQMKYPKWLQKEIIERRG